MKKKGGVGGGGWVGESYGGGWGRGVRRKE